MTILSLDQLKKLSTPRLLNIKRRVNPTLSRWAANGQDGDLEFKNLEDYAKEVLAELSTREHVTRSGKPTPVQTAEEQKSRQDKLAERRRKRSVTETINKGKAAKARELAKA